MPPGAYANRPGPEQARGGYLRRKSSTASGLDDWTNPGPACCGSRSCQCLDLRGVSALDFTLDELLDGVARLVVEVLHRRGLHEVGRGRQDRAADAAVQGDLRAAHRVDDDAGGVRGVPDLELVLQVQRDVAEGAAL